jgi:hypothetical protein
MTRNKQATTSSTMTHYNISIRRHISYYYLISNKPGANTMLKTQWLLENELF